MNNEKKPNILWILAEDMCPNLGCYGDPDAITPNLDALAEDGIRYDHVSSVGPVCSAARTTLAMGMYPTSVGTGNHRSCVELPNYMKIFSEYMQEVGYYTAINKTDYNFKFQSNKDGIKGWDSDFDSDYGGDNPDIAEAIANTWRKRQEEQPFFFMHTFACTHQSKYGFPSEAELHRKRFIPRTKAEHYRDREKLHIPSYHPDTKDSREIWGQYHETITAMDRMVGETIDRLKADNLYEDTIIFFFGDNGMGIPSGKFSMWNEGTNVPLIVRVPEKYKHLAPGYMKNSSCKQPVNFVDLPLTALELAQADVPSYMQGQNFLSQEFKDTSLELSEQYSFSYRNRIDSSHEVIRSIKNDQYLYIRNFYPHKGWRFSPYMAISSPYFMNSWEEIVKGSRDYNRKNAFFMPQKPVEELYDLKADPDQMHNLALDPNYAPMISDLRQILVDKMIEINDGGLMSEHELKLKSKGSTAYEVLKKESEYPLKRILNLCNQMFDENVDAQYYIDQLNDENAVIRYWAVQGLYLKADYSELVRNRLLFSLKDKSEMVKLAAAETILVIGESTKVVSKEDYKEDILQAKSLLKDFLTNREDVHLPLEAIDCMDRLGSKVKDLIPYTKDLVNPELITKEEGAARYVQAIVGLAKYYPEKMKQAHPYPDDDNWYNQRLLELRRLYK